MLQKKHLDELRSILDRLNDMAHLHGEKNAWLHPEMGPIRADLARLISRLEDWQAPATNVLNLPARRTPKAGRPDIMRVTLDVPSNQVDELTAAWEEIVSGKRLRATERARTQAEITQRALKALELMLTTVRHHPGTGQSGRVVRFLASLWDPSVHPPLDKRELRGLDTDTGNAIIDYLNYDRLGIASIDTHIDENIMVPLLRRYGLLPSSTRPPSGGASQCA